MLEYGVTQYKVVATSVLREAKNRAYVVDQIKIQNDMAIEVLEDDQEKTLIYSEILNGAMQDSSEKIDTALISYIAPAPSAWPSTIGKALCFPKISPWAP